MSDLVVGLIAPSSYSLNVTPGDSGLDLSTVSAASIRAQKPDGTMLTWSATRSNQTSTTLTLTYVFNASTSELDTPGTWSFYGKLTIPSGTARTASVRRAVLAEFEAR